MLKGKRILIVDDDDRNIFALSAALKPSRPELITAIDGEKCLKIIDEDPTIDLILLDMMMPVMDGYATLEAIRKNDKLKHIPVIALTAQAMPGDMDRCVNSGANDYCSKPVNIDILLGKIASILSL